MTAEKPAFVDTNVLVNAFDRAEPGRRAIAASLLDRLASSNCLRLSSQILQEFFVTVTRKIASPLPVDQALELLDDFHAWPLFLVDYEAIREAGALCGQVRLSFWDALVVVSAARSGADTLYSEDLSHDQIVRGVRIVNPFTQ